MQIVFKYSLLSRLPHLWHTHSVSVTPENPITKHMVTLLKGYKLRVHSQAVEPGIVYHGKGTSTDCSMFYRKVTIAQFTYCVSSSDKSRRLNSYVKVSSYHQEHLVR